MMNGTGDASEGRPGDRAGEVRLFRPVSDPAGPPYDHQLPRPKRAPVLFRDILHCLHLLACRRALIRRQVEGRIASPGS